MEGRAFAPLHGATAQVQMSPGDVFVIETLAAGSFGSA
jgi:hypothetical protein